jgi:hypothetical protein
MIEGRLNDGQLIGRLGRQEKIPENLSTGMKKLGIPGLYQK